MNLATRTLAVLFCIVTPALAQTRLFTVTDQKVPSGSRVKAPIWLGDINGDQCDDFAVPGGGVYYRTVTVFSGTDGQVLHSFDTAGQAILGGDIDGDGIREILSASSNSVWVNSGRTGNRLKVIPAFVSSWTFGDALSDAGDVDKDGVPDVLVGDWDGALMH